MDWCGFTCVSSKGDTTETTRYELKQLHHTLKCRYKYSDTSAKRTASWGECSVGESPPSSKLVIPWTAPAPPPQPLTTSPSKRHPLWMSTKLLKPHRRKQQGMHRKRDMFAMNNSIKCIIHFLLTNKIDVAVILNIAYRFIVYKFMYEYFIYFFKLLFIYLYII